MSRLRRKLTLALCVWPRSSAKATSSSTPVPVRCESLRTDCSACWEAGCQYCEVSSMQVRDPQYLSETERIAQQATMDYACVRGSCANLLLTRPATEHFKVLGRDKCADVALPTPRATTTKTTTEPPETTSGAMVALRGASQAGVHSETWFDTWGPMQWLAIAGPLSVLLCVCCGLFIHSNARSRNMKRVHVAPEPLPGGGGDAPLWDLTRAGPITPEQLEAVEIAIGQAERQAEKLGHAHPRRRLALAACNDLGKQHFLNIRRLLERHPAVSVRLDLDWRGASDAALEGLAGLIHSRDRCTFDVRRGRTGETTLHVST
eukprot:CAMPEP_0176089950 /NCGR_PEP_ID=MMETSP0120_2-20121206/45051_1 /TAXON_ID=160619 /ORGANISM="Kryptoperidinium foliaceum, Strain CCMP 1326" /LENGTH=318 /DNA_ID=CAMNT_0017423835 /DNA_START=11 /DNA_END=964 /DNA_ORIENTATION=-